MALFKFPFKRRSRLDAPPLDTASGTSHPPFELGQTFILEPILTPSGLIDSLADDTPKLEAVDFSFSENIELNLEMESIDSDPTVPDLNASDLWIEGDELAEEMSFIQAETDQANFRDGNISYIADDFPWIVKMPWFESGQFVVGETGEVTIDYLFDGGKYQGELAIFSLEGMEAFELGSEAFIQEAARRALSNSDFGYVVISDRTDGARFDLPMIGEGDWNQGDYQGAKTFQMRPGDEFGFMLVPHGQVQEVLENPAISGTKTPLFSLATANPDDMFHTGQIADVFGDGNTFVFEDLRADGQSDLDYNDLIFQVRGATGKAESLDYLLAPGKDWRTSDLGQALVDYTQPYVNPADGSANIPTAPISDQPLIGIIDTGFNGDNPDIDYSKITLGRDLVDGDTNPLLATGEGNEHGTHILGIIAAEQDNGLGIDGVNDEAPIWLGRGVGAGNWAESLIEFADTYAESEQPNGVVNLSMDLTQIDDQGQITTRYELTPKERAALEYARQRGILIVVPAGNDNGVMSALGQASQEFDNIITVGAAERALADPNMADAEAYLRTDYSSYGYGLDIMAAGGTDENPVLSTVGEGLGTMSGTSVAAAKVTGAVSHVWATNPDLSYRQIIDLLKDTATDLSTPNWDAETGAGLLNTTAAISMAKTLTPDGHTAPASWIPDTWSGEGKVTPAERAVQIHQTGNFSGRVIATVGANLRSGPSTSYAQTGSASYGTQLTYDAWTEGELISYPNLGPNSNRWYRLAGTTQWISAVITTGEPPAVVTPPSLPGYYPDLNSLSDAQWNEYVKDNTRFDVGWPDYRDERHLTPESIRNIYTDLSQALFGKRYAVTAGYLLDPGYRQGIGKWHSGLDIDTPDWEPVKAVVGGKTTLIQNETGDYFVGVQGDDGKLWIYGHLGSYDQPIGSRIEAGEILGKVGSIGSHLHLEVQPGPNYSSSQSADLSIVRNATLNPIKSFWELKNSNSFSGGNSGGGEGDNSAPPANPGQQIKYKVQAGDTLWDIARRYLGDGSRWREIQKSRGGPGFTAEEAKTLQIGRYVYIPVTYTSGSGGKTSNPPTNGAIAGMTPYEFGHLGNLDDTLWEIAERELGSGFRWKEIRQADGTTFTSDEARRIARGTIVYLPTVDSSNAGNPDDGDLGSDNQPQPISTVSEAGLQFIARHEGLRLNLYNDPAGHCTIGVGHLVHLGNCNGSEPAEFRSGISEQRAYELLRADANTAVQAVKNMVTVPLNQAQFDALTSFTFNLGSGNLQQSDLLRRLNNGEYDAVPTELNRWVYGGGVVLPGLVVRRQAEGKLFSTGSYA